MLASALMFAELAAQSPSAAAEPKVTSAYTKLDLNKCELIEEVDVDASWHCAGFAGTTIFVTEGDLRFDVSAGSNRSEDLCSGSPNCGFNYPPETIEWRLRDGQPFAIIYRLKYTIAETDRTSSRLIMETVGGNACRIASLDANLPDANLTARAAADASLRRAMPCIDAELP
jgi:hypothetical protein